MFDIGSDESDSKRNGFLSTRAEVHAVAHGLYNGMRRFRQRPGALPENDDVQKEPHYYKGAYVAGTILQWAIVLLVFRGLGAV